MLILSSGRWVILAKSVRWVASASRGRRWLKILRDDQALLATRSVGFEQEIPVPHALLPHYFAHSLPHPFPRTLTVFDENSHFLTHSAQRLARFDTSVERDDTTPSSTPHTPELRLFAGS